MSEKKVVLVTGSSSGNGQSIAQLLAQKGFVVFGTTRNPSSVQAIPGVDVLPLDVQLDESVNACINTLLKKAGRLDVLVNNAGYTLGGAIEETTLEQAKAQFETNFFGVARMVKAVLPIMRRQGNGQIINISSLVGLVASPLLGFYSASKFAMEGYTEALRHEVKPFQIRVSLVEPGLVKTNLVHNTQYGTDRISDYDPWQQRAADVYRQSVEKAIEPAQVAKCVLNVIQSKSPKLRYMVGKDASWMSRLHRLLPESLLEQGTRRFLHLNVKK